MKTTTFEQIEKELTERKARLDVAKAIKNVVFESAMRQLYYYQHDEDTGEILYDENNMPMFDKDNATCWYSNNDYSSEELSEMGEQLVDKIMETITNWVRG